MVRITRAQQEEVDHMSLVYLAVAVLVISAGIGIAKIMRARRKDPLAQIVEYAMQRRPWPGGATPCDVASRFQLDRELAQLDLKLREAGIRPSSPDEKKAVQAQTEPVRETASETASPQHAFPPKEKSDGAIFRDELKYCLKCRDVVRPPNSSCTLVQRQRWNAGLCPQCEAVLIRPK